MCRIDVNPAASDSVVIKNVAGDTLNVYISTQDQAPSTLAASASATVTQPRWIQSQGRTTVSLTGGQYGVV